MQLEEPLITNISKRLIVGFEGERVREAEREAERQQGRNTERGKEGPCLHVSFQYTHPFARLRTTMMMMTSN